MIFNSPSFALLSMIAIVITSTLAGYVVWKFQFWTINVIFTLFLATAIIPFEVYMIPLYFQVKALGALNSIGGLLIGYLVMSFGIFLIRQNVIAAVPDELIEAARIDGADEFWIFWHIVVPLLKGPIAALSVLAFFQAWTTFAPIVVLTRKTAFTIEVGLANFQSAYTVDLALLSGFGRSHGLSLSCASRSFGRHCRQRYEGMTRIALRMTAGNRTATRLDSCLQSKSGI